MTFIDGEIVEGSGGKTFRNADITVPLAGYDGSMPSSGQQVILGVRPEHTEIGAADAGGVPAIIDLDEPMGSDSLVWLTMAGKPISVRTTTEHGYRHGDRVSLALDMSKASLFDKETEQRL